MSQGGDAGQGWCGEVLPAWAWWCVGACLCRRKHWGRPLPIPLTSYWDQGPLSSSMGQESPVQALSWAGRRDDFRAVGSAPVGEAGRGSIHSHCGVRRAGGSQPCIPVGALLGATAPSPAFPGLSLTPSTANAELGKGGTSSQHHLLSWRGGRISPRFEPHAGGSGPTNTGAYSGCPKRVCPPRPLPRRTFSACGSAFPTTPTHPLRGAQGPGGAGSGGGGQRVEQSGAWRPWAGGTRWEATDTSTIPWAPGEAALELRPQHGGHPQRPAHTRGLWVPSPAPRSSRATSPVPRPP